MVIASLVALAPVPAITGILPAANSTVFKITFTFSSILNVADSPVVPTATIAFVPDLMWNSTNFLNSS